ncbi:hypothetical protein C8R46DRAFT_1097266 [Mycena filopes]|nr:hypothetical protein C8R46DRAFT_1097266 [Mycena filopes]
MTSLPRLASTHLRVASLTAVRHRPAAILQTSLLSRRMAHTHAEEYHNMPFDYSNRNKFALKCLAYMGFGFALPFIAVTWQWHKPGGYKNPL